MDKVEILYDAFKETYLQARKIWRVNILLALFAMLVILLVVRDAVLTNNAQPKMERYAVQIDAIDAEIESLSDAGFKSPRDYNASRIKYESAKLKVDEWHKDLPARKKMKEKYEKYLKEYSGSHDKVLERLKIDGEPGLDLFRTLRDAMVKTEEAKTRYDEASRERDSQRKAFSAQMARTKSRLENEKQDIIAARDALNEELVRIQQDSTRLPWVSLRVNPKDLIPFLPLLLFIFFHVMFDKFDELLTILRNPQLGDYRADLKVYPIPVFLGRRSFYALVTTTIFFVSVPIVQSIATWMTWQNQIGIFSFGNSAWQWMTGVGVLCTLASISYPVAIMIKHRAQIYSYS